MAFTAVISLAAYQAVIAIAHSSTALDFWGGILVSSAEIVLLVPLLSLPFIFGGFRSKRLRSEMTSTDKLLPVRYPMYLYLCTASRIRHTAWRSKQLQGDFNNLHKSTDSQQPAHFADIGAERSPCNAFIFWVLCRHAQELDQLRYSSGSL